MQIRTSGLRTPHASRAPPDTRPHRAIRAAANGS